MGAALTRLRANEPLRLFVYPMLIALAAYLVGQGTVDGQIADIAIGAVALLLGIPVTELARRKVTPEGHLADAVAAGADAALASAEAVVATTFGEPGAAVLQQIRARVAERGVSGGRHSAES